MVLAFMCSILLRLLGGILESLPADEKEAGSFLAGMTWAFVLFWGFLIITTWLYYASLGVRP